MTATDLTAVQIAERLSESFGTERTLKSVERKWARCRKEAKERGEILARPVSSQTPKSEAMSANPSGAGDQLEVDAKQNTMVLTSKGERITTLEQLLEVAKVDLKVWTVDHYIENKWEVAGKFGSAGNEYFELQDLWQVKAWLVRREPIQINPVVSPVNINVSSLSKIKRMDPDGLVRGLLLPDPQFGFRKSLRTAKLTPFHDRAALDVALQISQDYEHEYVGWVGDFMDLADWSDKFTRDPNFYWTTQPAAIEGKWWMTKFRMSDPEARMKLLEGNHEKRLREQLNNHLKEAFGLRSVDALDLPPLMSIPRILALHDLDIEWISDYPNGQSWINDFIVCEHGDIARAASGATVSAMLKDANESKIIGHIHRIESATKTIHEREGPRFVSVNSVGCLCRLDGAVPGKKARNNWQQAIGVVEYYLDGRPDHKIDAIPIVNGRAIYNGKVYEAVDRTEELRDDVLESYQDDIGWNF